LELNLIDEVEAPPVRLAYLRSPSSKEPVDVQLVEPTGPGAIADFLEDHGEGLHHICFQVEDIASTLRKMPGEERTEVFTGGRQRPACFLTAKLTGVLVEFTQVPMG
jgi:4-hydroxyphenylpyruvate dioxygenase and related hemolysins